MKLALLSIFLALPACTQLGTHTALYYPNGQIAFMTAGDNTGIEVDMTGGGAGKFKALTNTHSTTVLAHGAAYSQVIGAAGNAVSQNLKPGLH